MILELPPPIKELFEPSIAESTALPIKALSDAITNESSPETITAWLLLLMWVWFPLPRKA